MNETEQPLPSEATPTPASEPEALPTLGPGKRGCFGISSVTGKPCGASPVRGTKLCVRHTLGDAEWKAAASRGGRASHGERLRKKLMVPPETARALIAVIVPLINESTTVEDAVRRLAPFTCEDRRDAELLADELSKLKSLSAVRSERLLERNTSRILEQSEGLVYR